MKILVTGGTGVLGCSIARAAERSGHSVRIGSRRPRPEGTMPHHEWALMDVVSGKGVADALAGVDSVVHAASDPWRPAAVDENGTRLAVEAARAAGVSHFFYVSIVGIDRIPLGYYRAKLTAEHIVTTSGVPYSILRATQFHTLVDRVLTAASRFPLVMPLPTSFRIQSLAPSDLAERLLADLVGGPRGRLPDFGGPEVLTLGEAAEQWKAARKVQKWVMHVPIPGRTAAAFRAGENTVRDDVRSIISWREWLSRSAAPLKVNDQEISR